MWLAGFLELFSQLRRAFAMCGTHLNVVAHQSSRVAKYPGGSVRKRECTGLLQVLQTAPETLVSRTPANVRETHV
jgi:hypothetical protein